MNHENESTISSSFTRAFNGMQFTIQWHAGFGPVVVALCTTARYALSSRAHTTNKQQQIKTINEQPIRIIK